MVNYKPNNNIAKFNEERKKSRDRNKATIPPPPSGIPPAIPKKDPELDANFLKSVIVKNIDTMVNDKNSDPKEIREWLKLGHKNIEVRAKVKIKPKTIFDEDEF